jgi:hypothetical protein
VAYRSSWHGVRVGVRSEYLMCASTDRAEHDDRHC